MIDYMSADHEMTSQRRILFVAHSPWLYGAERSLLDVSAGLKARGWHPEVIVPAAGDFSKALEERDIPYMIVQHKAWIGSQPRLLRIPYRVLLNLLALRKASGTLAGRFDLVYTNTISKPLGILLSKKLGLPHIVHVREFVDSDLGESYDFGKKRSLAWAGLNSEKIICNSRAVLDGLKPFIPEEKLVMIYNGLLDDTSERIAPRNSNEMTRTPLRLCMVGHLDPHKGHTDAIRALAILNKSGRGAELQVAGTGDDRYMNRLIHLAAELGIEKRLSFLGYRTDIDKVFKDNDIQLVCSYCEAFGRVAVESMALGVPVIGSRSGGLPEIVRDGSNGLLYQSGDADELASKICLLLDNPELYEQFSQQGQADVFSWFSARRCIDSIEKNLLDVLREWP